jgi:hypothetical protein
VQRGGHLVVVTLDGLPDRLVEPPISRVKSSLQPSSGKHSQAILGPLMGVIQDMYLHDTHKTHIKVGGTLRHSFPLHQLERATYTTNHDARACSLTQQLYRELGVVCLYAQVRGQIFRGDVQVRGSATYFSRPTPAASQFANRLPR